MLDNEMRSVTSLLNEHASALTGAGTIAEAVRAGALPDPIHPPPPLRLPGGHCQSELLAQADAKKEASYARGLHWDERVRMADWWAGLLGELRAG